MTKLKVTWSAAAIKQFSATISFILNDSEQNAFLFREKIIKKLNKISYYPEMCPPDIYKIDNDGSYRAFNIGHIRTSYRITNKGIFILRLRHTSMKPKYY